MMLNKIFVILILLFTLFSGKSIYAEPNTKETQIHSSKIPAPPLSERIYGLSLLWSEAKFSFAFFDQVPELDWDAEYQKYVKRIETTETMYEYYRELQSFTALLSDGHTGVSMPQTIKTDIVPVRVEVIGQKYYVKHVAAKLVKNIPVGSEIVAVKGKPINDYVNEEVEPFIGQSSPQATALFNGGYLLESFFGESIRFSIITPSGERSNVMAYADYFYGPDVEFIPTRKSRSFGMEWVSPDIAIVNLSTFGDNKVAEKFAEIVPELHTAKGIILDIRMNGGGMTNVATDILRHFTDRELHGPRWTTRKHQAAHRVWGAHGIDSSRDFGELNAWTEPMNMPKVIVESKGALFGKPVVILTSARTASTSEDFLIYADPLTAITRIGQTTMGTTGQPLPLSLPGGGSARICTKRDTWPDGTDFVGVGIQPDIVVPITLDAIINNRDQTVIKAIEFLESQI